MVTKSIDALANQFIILANKPKLSKAERNKTRQLMGLLKQVSLSNEEISELSGGRWSPRTIKCYTPGIKVSHPTQYDNVVKLLEKLKSSNLTLEDVDITVAIREELQSRNVSFEDAIDKLFAIDTSNVEIVDLIHQLDVFEKHGLTPEKLPEALSAMEELRARGFSLDSMVMLLQAANTYSETPEILKAISTYNSLLKLKEEVKAAEEELKGIEAARHDQENRIKVGEEKLSELATLIYVYHRISELGYDEQTLVDLANLSVRFGGPKVVIQALLAYMDYKDIDSNVVKAKTHLADLESEIAKKQSEYGYLTTAINICLKLVNECNFGIDAVETLLSAAKKYGDALEVLKAIDAFGRSKALLEEIDKLQGIIATSKQRIAQLNGEYEDNLKKLQSLNALILQVGSELGKVHCQTADSAYVNQLLKLINNPYGADYGTYINVTMIMARALKAFVTKYESNFMHRVRINDGLGCLIMDLGGVYDIGE